MARPTAQDGHVHSPANCLFSTQMRLIVVLLALVGLLASPAVAAAAQVGCYEADHAAMATDMPGMAGMDAMTGTAAPCCDPGKSPQAPHKKPMPCALACAVMSGVTMVSPGAADGLWLTPTRVLLKPALSHRPRAHAPPRLERPPRSIV